MRMSAGRLALRRGVDLRFGLLDRFGRSGGLRSGRFCAMRLRRLVLRRLRPRMLRLRRFVLGLRLRRRVLG